MIIIYSLKANMDLDLLIRVKKHFMKLRFYGFDDEAISIIRNFFTTRMQALKFAGNLSDFVEILLGVPQGSST